MEKLRTPWTPEEDDVLYKYGTQDRLKTLSKKLPGRGLPAIQLRKHKLGVTNRRVVSEEHLRFIKDNCSSHSDVEISMLTGLPKDVVVYQRRLLGVHYESRGRSYSHEDIQIIQSKYLELSDLELASILNRTEVAIKAKRQHLNLFRT